jgi:hypothetical protein
MRSMYEIEPDMHCEYTQAKSETRRPKRRRQRAQNPHFEAGKPSPESQWRCEHHSVFRGFGDNLTRFEAGEDN